jgi:hypothetical protein
MHPEPTAQRYRRTTPGGAVDDRLLSTNRGDHRTPRAQPVAGPAPAPPEARGDRGPQPVRTESARGPSQAGDDQ